MIESESHDHEADATSADSTSADSLDVPETPAAPLPPTFMQYIGVVLGGWFVIAVALAILKGTLPSGRGLLLLGFILGFGLLGICIFDYIYLRLNARSSSTD